MVDPRREGFVRDGTFVELYAGMAAVTWSLAGGVPPVCYMGGKRRQAADILRLMALAPGDVRRVVLVEADPTVAAVLRFLFGPRDAHRRAIAAWQTLALAGADAQHDMFTAFVDEGFADLPEHLAATRWLWMRNRTLPQVQPQSACASSWKGQRGGGTRTHWGLDNPSQGLARLAALPWPVDVVCAKASEVAPIPGAVAYLDPPYVGTNGYAVAPDEAVENVAERWCSAGADAYVSEGRPVPGGTPYPIAGRDTDRGPGNQIGKAGHVAEYLTAFEAPR